MPTRSILMMGRILDQEDGLGLYGYYLFRHLLRADPDTRYVVALRSPKHFRSFAEFPNAEVVLLPSRSKLWWDQVTISRAARRLRADIVFNPKFSLPIVSAIPGVMVLHSADWYVNPGNYAYWDNLYIRLLLPVYCRKAKGILAISEAIVRDLALHGVVKPEKVRVSYAAPGSHFRPIEDPAPLEAVAKKYNLPEHFIFSTARAYHTGHASLRMYPGANVETLLRGYRSYRERGGDLALVIAGRAIDRYLAEQGYTPRELKGIHLIGFVPTLSMAELYNLATFFVLTTFYESFSLSLVEAMASGCPVLGPSTGAVPEVAGGAALLVDPRDELAIAGAMKALADSPDLRASHRQAGLQRAAEFTWPRTAQRTIAVFNELVPIG